MAHTKITKETKKWRLSFVGLYDQSGVSMTQSAVAQGRWRTDWLGGGALCDFFDQLFTLKYPEIP
jgi:hypothetical protein